MGASAKRLAPLMEGNSPRSHGSGDSDAFGGGPANMTLDFTRLPQDPASAVGRLAPLTARTRYIRHCAEAMLPPEPLLLTKGNRELTALTLQHKGIGNRLATALADGVAAMDQVETVDLRNNRLSAKAVTSFCASLTGTSVRVLDLCQVHNHDTLVPT